MNSYLIKHLNKKYYLIIVILCVAINSKLRRIIKYILVIICRKSIKIIKFATLSVLILLVSSAPVNAYPNIPKFTEYIAGIPVVVCFPYKMSTPVLKAKNQFSSEILPIKQNSNLLNLNRKNYREKVTFTDKKQNNKNQNVIYNFSNKRALHETIPNHKLLIETQKSKSNFLLKKTIFNLFFLNVVNLTFSRQIVSAFYLVFNNQSILILKTTSCFLKQDQIFFNNFYQTYFDKKIKQKPKYIIITESLRSIGYKVNDKLILTCDSKKHNLHSGDVGEITSINEKTNKVSVLFLVGQPVKSLQFRKSLNNLVNLFARQV